MEIRKEILDELIKDYKNPEDLIGEQGLLKQLTKALLERAMEAELTHELGYEKNSRSGGRTLNRRNGSSSKTVRSKHGEVALEVPRDRDSEFEPVLIKKHQRRFDGFDDLILSLYSRGVSTRDIRSHIEDLYGVEVSPDLISSVTDNVQEFVREWQTRPLDAVYPIVYLDALRVKIRVDGSVQNRCIYLAIGVNLKGRKEALGLWSAETEGAKFWLSVLTELNNRGVRDIFIACVDGLKGFTEAIESVFPEAITQLCIVHQIRNSLAYVSHKEKKKVAADLKPVYTAATEEEALAALEAFAEKWDSRYTGHLKIVAGQLAEDKPDVPFYRRHPHGGLYHQRYRIAQLFTAENHQNQGRLPDRGSRHQTSLAGIAKRIQKMDNAHQKLGPRDDPIRHHLRRQTAHRRPKR